MTELLTAAQMRAIEAAAIASGEVTGLELMERAGRGVVEAIFEEWPELRAGSFRAVVLCGPGGNGGDGFVVARLLKEWGWEVEVFLYGAPEGMPADARVNYEQWSAMGEVRGWNDEQIANRIDVDRIEICVDALFGLGLSRTMPFNTKETSDALVQFVYTDNGRSVSIDLPSGVCSDSGRCLGDAFASVLTVTFHKPKVAHFVADGCASWGQLSVKDIGLGEQDQGGHTMKSERLPLIFQ